MKTYEEYSDLPGWSDIAKASKAYNTGDETEEFQNTLEKIGKIKSRLDELTNVVYMQCPHELQHHRASNRRVESSRSWHNLYRLDCIRCGRTLRLWNNLG